MNIDRGRVRTPEENNFHRDFSHSNWYSKLIDLLTWNDVSFEAQQKEEKYRLRSKKHHK